MCHCYEGLGLYNTDKSSARENTDFGVDQVENVPSYCAVVLSFTSIPLGRTSRTHVKPRPYPALAKKKYDRDLGNGPAKGKSVKSM